MDAQLHGLLGQASYELDQTAASIRALEAAIQIQPEQSSWRLDLARSHVKAKDFKQAKDALQQLLELEPDHEEAKKMLEGLPK